MWKMFPFYASSCNWLSLQCLVPWINHLPLHVGPVSEIKFHLVCKFDIMNNIFFHCVNSLNMYSISTKIIYVMYVVFTLMIIGPECEAQRYVKCALLNCINFCLFLHVWGYWFFVHCMVVLLFHSHIINPCGFICYILQTSFIDTGVIQ